MTEAASNARTRRADGINEAPPTGITVGGGLVYPMNPLITKVL
ncbi:hypothetical protein AusDCA_2721 [Desulfitobacterium sp. AusDCA]